MHTLCIWLLHITYVPNATNHDVVGVPIDGIPREVEITIKIELSIFFVFLASVGIILAIVGMCLHFKLRKKTYVNLKFKGYVEIFFV